MNNLRLVTKSVGNLIGIVRATKRTTRMLALFVLVAVITATAFSLPSSAKLIENIFSNTPLTPAAHQASATGANLNAPAEETPVITTDKSDYEPGETITFTGTNWTPGETVTIVLQGDGAGESAEIQATADDSGSFTVTATMPGSEEPASASANSASAARGQAKIASVASVESNTVYTVTATGGATGATAQVQIRKGEPGEMDGEEDDPDLPAFMAGKINKEDYLRRRTEHINKLRGIHRGRPVDPSARGRAIREMNRQEGRPDTATSTIDPVNSVSTTDGSLAGAQVAAAAAISPVWKAIGPYPLPNGQTFNTNNITVSGRTVAIALHPTNSNIAYVGAAQGGVYRTLDAGATWTPIFDNAQSLAIGSIAISPSQPSTIYVGTGEGNFGCDSFYGVGVYRIDNADGASPTLTGPLNKDANGNDVLSGWATGKILVHPTNPDIVFVSTTTGYGGLNCTPVSDTASTSTKPRGLFRSTNATQANPTFSKLTIAGVANGGNRSISDLEFEPGNPNTLLATVFGGGASGADAGVYRTNNALAATPTFSRTLAVGDTSDLFRTELAIHKNAVTNQVTVFAAYSQNSGSLKRSIDGGATWTASAIGTSGFCGTQCTYDMPIAVDPTNANIVYLGGAGDSGAAHILTKVTNALSTPTFTASQTGLHADEHAIEIDPNNPSIVWTGNDGGIFKSTNAAATWTSMNNTGYSATQFVSLALHATDANFTIGGTQDNGTECLGPCGNTTGSNWNQADYGDGGFALIDQSTTSLINLNMYHTYYNVSNTLIGYSYVTNAANAKFTSSPTSNNWSFIGTGGSVGCTGGGGYACAEAVEFYMPLALGPGSPNPVYSGTDRLHRSPSPGASNATVSQVFVAGVPISAVGISPQNDSVRIVGLENGKVFRTMTAQTTGWADVSGTIPTGTANYISRAVIDPNNQNTAYITLSIYFGNSTPHIYKTTNLNATTPTWTGIGATIPDVPVNAFAVDPANSNMLYAGTDIGVYRSTDGGATWEPFSNGLPRVAVFDMAIQNPNRILRIATHGRGMWDISLNAPVAPGTLQGIVTDSATSAPINGATVIAGVNTTTTNASGFYLFGEIEPATYSVTASAPGYNNSASTNVVVTSGGTTTQNFALAPAPTSGCLIDTTQANFQSGVGTSVDLTGSPGNVTLANNAAAIDQQQTTLSSFVDSITTTAWQAQTFVPAVSGKLSQVDFQSALSSTGVSGTMLVEIRNLVSGAPGSTVLATANLTSVSGTTNAWYSVTFATPSTVNAGTGYALVLRASSGGPYRAVRSQNNTYASGAWYSSTNSGGAWAAQNSDLAFRTYMTPSTFVTSGDLVSSIKDANPAAGVQVNWTTLSWTAATPANTTVKFQAASSNAAIGPFNFVGPDGTANTFFTTSGASLSQFSGKRYLKYKAFLSTTSSSVTPTLNDMTTCFVNGALPSTTLTVSSASGTYGGTTALTATLNSGSSPLGGKLITFTLNGNSVGSGVTNASGVATLANASLAGINAGSYLNGVGASFAADGSYAASSGSNSLTVNKVTTTVTWSNPASIVYGTALGATQLNATASVPGSFVYNPAAGTVLGAGNNQTLHADFTPTDTTNYNTASKDVTINVTKVTLTVKANNQTRPYGDANPALTYTMTGFAGSDTQASATTGQPDITTTANGTSAPGTYPITAANGTLSAANYTFSFVNGTLTVTKASQTITFDTLATKTFGDADFTVSATASSGLAVSLAASGNCTLSGSTVHITGAGACTINASQGGNANYNAAPNVSQSFTVNKANSATSVSVGNATYDGQPHGGNASVNGAGGLSQNLTVTYQGRNATSYGPSTTAPTDAGDYTASATFGGDADHNGSSDAKEFQITKAASTTAVTFEAGPYVYRGSAYMATASVNGAGGLSTTLTVVYNGDCTNVTTADGCTATATYSGDANHEGSNDSKSITITKATASIALGDLSQTYSGAARIATATTSPNGLGGVTVTYNNSTTAPTAAGSYTVVASLNNQNYEAEDATGTLTVGKAAPVMSATGNACTYNGATCAGSGSATGVDNTDLGAVTLIYTPGGSSAPTSAGSYTVVASIAETANHTAGSSEPASVTIAKAMPTVSVSGGTFTYDGNTHPATGIAYGVGGASDVLTPAVTFTYNGSDDAPFNADTYTIVASFGGNDNYLPASNSTASIVIGKASATINVSGYTGVYDSHAHGATGSAAGVNGENLTSLLDLGASFTNVPGGTAHWTFAGNNNYSPASGDATITISKANSTIEWSNPADIVYGTALGATQLNATASVPGSFVYNPAAGTVLGAGNNQTLHADFTPTDTTNYNTASNDVSINVLKASQSITFGALANKTYGDAPFNVSATGGASGNPVTFAATGNCTASGAQGSTITITGAGNCTVTASQGGNANYTAAPDVARSFQIAKASATITLSNLYYLYDGQAHSATATTNPNGLSGVTVNYVGTTLSYNSTTPPTAAGTYTVTASLANIDYAASNASATFVINAAPNVTITAPASGTLYAKGSTVNFTGAFIDNPGTHTATWTFTSGTQTITQAATVNEATGAVNANYTFLATGVYTMKLTVSDNFGVTGVATTVGGVTGAGALIAVYDPSSTGGSVSTTTKSPLYNSLAGWYPANPTLAGTATTGFNAAYPSATATVPTGQAVFNFPAANLSFVSAGYQWMVVTRPYVWLRGSGTVNNVSGYEFLIAAVDGQLTGGGGTDKFRIRIWRKSDGVVIYDNIPGGALNAVATTVTSNGDIAIK